MNVSDHNKWIIKQYEKDEEMMVLIFAQWCINHQLDPINIYESAYPNQQANKLLEKLLENTVTKKESKDISTAAVLQVLQDFGNDDLAFAVQRAADEHQIDT